MYTVYTYTCMALANPIHERQLEHGYNL
jgi:hypothetical protein